MIAADVIRGVMILGLLLVRTPSTVWLAYVVTAVTVGASGFFEPARSVHRAAHRAADQLVAANAVSTGTWSAMLAIGASLGGAVAALWGRDTAFLLEFGCRSSRPRSSSGGCACPRATRPHAVKAAGAA